MHPLELIAGARQTAIGLFEAASSSTRKKISEVVSFEKALISGSCLPLVSSVIGPSRVFYGSVLFAFASAELINKIATSKLGKEASLSERVALLKGGVAPVFLRSFEHISMGLTASASLWGTITCIFYEMAIKPLLPTIFSQEVTVDPEALNKLSARIQRHSLYLKIERYGQELKQLVFSA